MKKIFFSKISKFTIFCFVVITFITVPYVVITFDYNWFFILWNFFLAALPIYFAMFAQYFFAKSKKTKGVVFSALWFLFFPNALYMLTDFKYISSFSKESWDNYTSLGSNVLNWLFLLSCVVSIFSAVIVGLMSVYIMHRLVYGKIGKFRSFVSLEAVFVISSFGIYIGRFVRLNSWDIVNPPYVFQKIISVITPFCPVFVLIFTTLSTVLYLLFYFLFKRINQF